MSFSESKITIATQIHPDRVEIEKDEINVPMALGVFRDGNRVELWFVIVCFFACKKTTVMAMERLTSRWPCGNIHVINLINVASQPILIAFSFVFSCRLCVTLIFARKQHSHNGCIANRS